METLILLAVFLGVTLLVVGGYLFVNRRRLELEAASRSRLRAASGGVQLSILRDDRASDLPFLNAWLSRQGFTTLLGDQLARAGSKQNVGTFLLTSVLCGGIGFLIGQRFIGAIMAVGFTLAGLALPYVRLKLMQARRQRRFEEQLPDAIDMLVNALKAGYSLQAGMEFVGKEVAEPLGPEFLRFYEEQRLGVDVRAALLDLQERVGTQDMKMFVTALLIQRETGGNLSEILMNIATLVRDRLSFRGHVRALTAEPRLSANVLALVPIFVFFIIMVVNRDYISILVTTERGQAMLLYAAASVIVGYVAMMKIAKVEL